MIELVARVLRVLVVCSLGLTASAQVERQKIEGTGLLQGDNFGRSVALSGDWAVLGAHDADDLSTNSGAAYVFEHTATGWIERQRLKASDPVAGAGFGYAVQIQGSTIAIGAPGSSHLGTQDVGAIYIFQNVSGVWTETQKLVPSDAALNYGCGYSVALAGHSLIGGAIGEWHAGPHTGAAYIFENSGGTWAQSAKVIASDGAGGDLLGYSVAIEGNLAAGLCT